MQQQELEARMARMERELRCWRWGLLAVCAVGLALGTQRGEAQGQAQGTTLKAPLRVVDEQGKELLDVSRLEGQPVLTVFGVDGNTAVRTIGSKNGGVVEAFAGEKSAITLGATRLGGMVVAWNKDGKPAVEVRPSEEGAGMVTAMHGGRLVASPGTDEAGAAALVSGQKGGGLVIKDSRDRISAVLAHQAAGGGALVLDGGPGKGMAQLQITEGGGGHLLLGSGEGKPRVTVEADQQGAGLSIYDGKDKRVFKAP